MVSRTGHSLVELLVALTVLGVGLGSVSAASVFAMRSTNDALLRERTVVLAAATLDSLTALPAPGGGTLHVSGIRMEWSVAASADGGDIRLAAWPEGTRRWTERLHARFLAPVPVLAP
jgi:prepilin-type N-terminal cleavage/methylation domain-containing protein